MSVSQRRDTLWFRHDAGASNDRDARKAAMFDRIDADHNGSISRDEFMAARPRGPGRDEAGRDGPMAGMGHGGHGGHHRGGRGGMGMMMLHMADANKDGSVTRAEFDAAVAQHFDQVDTNHDGTITGDERRAAHSAMKARMEAMHGGGDMGDHDMDGPAN